MICLRRISAIATGITLAATCANAQVADVLSFIEQTAQPSEHVVTSAEDNGIEGILGAIYAVTSSDDASATSVATFSALSPLNYVEYVYSIDDYHRSGSLLGDRVNTRMYEFSGNYRSMSSSEWGRITSGFGYRARFGRMHKGVDFAMASGYTVRVPLPGRIDRVDFERHGYGHFVVVRHDNGMETRYAHLSSVLVREGEYVSQGQPIALSGNTGNSTGPHLHFETRYMGSAVDPMSVFDFGAGFMRAYRRQESDGAGVSERMATGLNASKVSLKRKSTYIVREGDTVAKIAKRAGLSTLRLCQLNFITESDRLEHGVMLRLR